MLKWVGNLTEVMIKWVVNITEVIIKLVFNLTEVMIKWVVNLTEAMISYLTAYSYHLCFCHQTVEAAGDQLLLNQRSYQ